MRGRRSKSSQVNTVFSKVSPSNNNAAKHTHNAALGSPFRHGGFNCYVL